MHICRQLLRLSVAGPLLGLAFGLATSVCLLSMRNRATLEILLTILAAYAAYIVSNFLCGSSGILSVVALGELLSSCFKQLSFGSLPSFAHSLVSMP